MLVDVVLDDLEDVLPVVALGVDVLLVEVLVVEVLLL